MTAGRSQRAALEVIGLSKSSFHYRSKPRAPVAVPVLHRDRHQPAALSQHERDQVCQLLAQGAKEGLRGRPKWSGRWFSYQGGTSAVEVLQSVNRDCPDADDHQDWTGIDRALVEAHSGIPTARSGLGHGGVFTARLPLSPEATGSEV